MIPSSSHPYRFAKAEHLCSLKQIERLFMRGSKSLSVYPIRIIYHRVDVACTTVPVQVMVSVSKRHFKHAVDRNRIKRQLREAYRLNKGLLQPLMPEGVSTYTQQWQLAIVWQGAVHLSFDEISQKLRRILSRMVENHEALT